jgi:hypothetical protein
MIKNDNPTKSMSRISLRTMLRKDAPQYIIDFFSKGTQHPQIPTVLYTYGFTFDNQPNFRTGTFLLFQKIDETYHLQIEHQFDAHDEMEAPKGYWFTGGLGQYFQDTKMAGYIVHADTDTQLFGFRDKVVFWHNDVLI